MISQRDTALSRPQYAPRVLRGLARVFHLGIAGQRQLASSSLLRNLTPRSALVVIAQALDLKGRVPELVSVPLLVLPSSGYCYTHPTQANHHH